MKMVTFVDPQFIEKRVSDPRLDAEEDPIEQIEREDEEQRIKRLIAVARTISASARVYRRAHIEEPAQTVFSGECEPLRRTSRPPKSRHGYAVRKPHPRNA